MPLALTSRVWTVSSAPRSVLMRRRRVGTRVAIRLPERRSESVAIVQRSGAEINYSTLWRQAGRESRDGIAGTGFISGHSSPNQSRYSGAWIAALERSGPAPWSGRWCRAAESRSRAVFPFAASGNKPARAIPWLTDCPRPLPDVRWLRRIFSCPSEAFRRHPDTSFESRDCGCRWQALRAGGVSRRSVADCRHASRALRECAECARVLRHDPKLKLTPGGAARLLPVSDA